MERIDRFTDQKGQADQQTGRQTNGQMERRSQRWSAAPELCGVSGRPALPVSRGKYEEQHKRKDTMETASLSDRTIFAKLPHCAGRVSARLGGRVRTNGLRRPDSIGGGRAGHGSALSMHTSEEQHVDETRDNISATTLLAKTTKS
ncbi:unnamed protein product [Lota lota]